MVPLTALIPGRRLIAARMSEHSLDACVRRLIKELGLSAWHVRNSIGMQPGWPDWVILGRGGCLFRELKSQHGTLSPDQRRAGSLLTTAGCDWCVWRPADLADGTIRRQLASIAAEPLPP